MTLLARLLTMLAALAALLPATARASDFSMFADPAFSRIGFLTQQRMDEIGCVHYAAFASRNGKGVSPAESLTLRQAVIARLQTELGSDEWAVRVLEATDFASSGFEKAERDAAYAQLAPVCAPLIGALRAGNLPAALAPLAGSPIALPDIETCLAYDVLAQKLNLPVQDSLFNDPGGPEGGNLRTLLLGKTPEERSARSQRVAALAAAMPPIPPADLARRIALGCILPIVTEYRRLDPYGDFAEDPLEEPEAASSDEE